LPLEESKQFYSVLQEIERNWWEKKRKLDLEEKRAIAGGSNISMTTPQGSSSPSPAGDDMESKLVKVKSLFDKGLITDEEYKARKEKILNEL
jgi:hypothetical protein